MGSLFNKIAKEIANRVERIIDVSQIFKTDVEEMKTTLKTAKQLLDSWYLVYMQVRMNFTNVVRSHFDDQRSEKRSKLLEEMPDGNSLDLNYSNKPATNLKFAMIFLSC